MSDGREVPHLPPGTVLDLGADDWRYGDQRLRLMVEFVRLDLSRYYDNEWVWISGQRLARDGSPLGHLDALVRVAALPGGPTTDGNGTSHGNGAATGRARGHRRSANR